MAASGSRKGREVGARISSSLPTPRTPLPPHWKDRPNHPADLQPPNILLTRIEATSVPAPAPSDAHSPVLLKSGPSTSPPLQDPADADTQLLLPNTTYTPPSFRFKSPTRSKPIPIPSFRRDLTIPTTPLTGRLESRGAYFPHHYHTYASSPAEESPTNTDDFFRPGHRNIASVSSTLSSTMVTERPSRLYTPTSPLSPTMNPSMRPMSPQPSQARPTHSPTKPMRLSSLPRYHPQAYQSPNRAPPNTSQPSYRPSSPLGNTSSHYRVPSDSQKALRQYQRDLLAHAKLSSSVAATPSSAKPAAPRLDPLGSPGPVTPLALEEDGGSYLTAGMGGVSNSDSPIMSGDEDSADVVDKYIRKENKRWEKKSRGSRDMRGSPVLMATGRD